MLCVEEIYFPNQLIINELSSEKDDNGVFFILQGAVQIFLAKSETVLKHCKSGACFGE